VAEDSGANTEVDPVDWTAENSAAPGPRRLAGDYCFAAAVPAELEAALAGSVEVGRPVGAAALAGQGRGR